MILVTGATGFVGHTIAARLVKEGERPRCLVRNRETANKLLPADSVELVQGNILHPETLSQAFEGIDLVIDSSFMTAERKQSGEERYYNVNVEGTNNIILAAKQAGVKRLLIISGMGTRSDKPGTYMQGRYLAEEAVKNSGLGWSIAQPSIQFGPHSAFFKGLADLIRQVPVIVPVAGSGNEQFQPIWVEDVVTCIMQIVRNPARDGKVYPMGGSEIITYGQVLDMLMETLKIKKIKVPGPQPIVMLAAAAMEAILPKPPITTAALELFKFPNRDQPDILQTTFGVTPMRLQAYLSTYGVD